MSSSVSNAKVPESNGSGSVFPFGVAVDGQSNTFALADDLDRMPGVEAVWQPRDRQFARERVGENLPVQIGALGFKADIVAPPVVQTVVEVNAPSRQIQPEGDAPV